MKRTLKHYRKLKVKGKIYCPECMLSNQFKLFEMTNSAMQFECLSCGRVFVSPFLNINKK